MSDATTSAAHRARAPHTHPDHGATIAESPSRESTARTSAHESHAHQSHAIEPWARVLLAALVPAIGAIYLPAAFRIPLFVLTGLLFIAGVVMLGKQESTREVRRD